ncbi:TF29 protein, partial [Pardalotus punctatus]|nr:TF29 protein [Pardalotus punctatus]
WEGIQYTFTRLPQGYRHSPTLAHDALAQELSIIPIDEGVRIYQYIDDVLIGGPDTERVRNTQNGIIKHLESVGLQIPEDKIQHHSPEVKFLGIWWKGGAIPENRKELQHVLGILVFWRKHIPDFSIVARPLYDLTRKKAKWEWTPLHSEALKLLTFEASMHQVLG